MKEFFDEFRKQIDGDLRMKKQIAIDLGVSYAWLKKASKGACSEVNLATAVSVAKGMGRDIWRVRAGTTVKFGHALYAKLGDLGFAKCRFSKEIGISDTELCSICSGRSQPRLRLAIKVSDTLKCDLGPIIYKKEQKK